MHTRTLFILSAAAVAAIVVSLLLLVVVSVARINLNSLAFGGTVLLVLLGFALSAAAWLLGLMRTARIHRWDWFVEVLVLGPLGSLIFACADPTPDSSGAA